MINYQIFDRWHTNSLIRKLQHAFGKYCGCQSQVALNQLECF